MVAGRIVYDSDAMRVGLYYLYRAPYIHTSEPRPETKLRPSPFPYLPRMLSKGDMVELGVKKGDSLKILKAVKEIP